MIPDDSLAKLFSALGHPSRVAVLRILLEQGAQSLSFGDLVERSGVPASTLGFHLREMEAAGIIGRKALGRSTQVGLQIEVLLGAVTQLTALCCVVAPFDIEKGKA